MNKVACIAIMVLLLPSISVPAPTLTSERAVIERDAVNSLSISFDLSGIDQQSSVIDNKEYIKFSLEGEGVTQKAGMPELPAVSRYIIVPPDKSVELVVTHNPELQVHANMSPSAVLEQPGTEDQLTTVNSSYYADGGLYPAQPAEISRPILIRHVRLVKVTVYPVQYNPRTQSYIERSEVGVELRFGDGEVINPANVSFERIPSPQFQILLESLALNPAPRRDPRELVEARGYNEYFLFVLQDDIRENIEDDVHDLVARLVEWKRRSGNKVDMLRIPGNQARNPGAIENAIQDRYDELLEEGIEPFDNLLLIGEDETNPYSANCRQGFDLMLVGPTSQRDTNPWVDHYDVKFGQLEGDDIFPDVAVNRFHSGDLPTLAGGVNKTINYQSEPYMEDTDWYTEAVVEEQALNGSDQTSTYCVDYYVEALVRNGFDVVAQWRRANGGQGGDPGPWLADQVNERIGCIAGRAKNYTMDYVWGHSPQNMFEAVGVFPIAILNSGHGEWAMETLWWVGREEYANRDRIHDIRWAKGAVAATSTWARFTDNHYNTHHQNTLGTAMVHGMLDLRLSMGWSRVFTLLNFARTFPGDDFNIEFYCSNFGCCGDPAIRYWRGVPRLIEVDHPDHLAECGNYIPVLVYDEEDEEPIEGIEVTVYKGEMNEVEWFETKFTNADGFCEFIIDPELEGPILITALETDVYPYMGEIDREETNIFVQASITDIDDSEGGNDDGIVNPGETIVLSFDAENFGVDGTARNVIGTLTSSSTCVEIEDNHIVFGDIESGRSSEGDGTAVINVAASCPDGIPIDMLMQLESNNGDWTSGLRLDPISFDVVVAEIENDGVVPRGIEWMDFELRNIGRLPIPAFTARILSSGWELGAPVATSDYNGIPVDGERGPRNNGFRLSGNLMAIPGTSIPVTLLIEVGGEVVDSAFCHLQISEPYEGAPQGPDAYGYICFDDTDTSFQQAPEYEWIEVSTEADWDLRGTRIDRLEGGNSNGYAVVDLPFIFQYYGEEFDQITVCTNGFLTAGTDPNFVPNFQNFPLEGGGQGAGYGMIAPFWDNLSISGNNNPGIWYAYDENQGQFIVEWYNVHFDGGGGSELNFEVILYDRDVWANATRDGFIGIQYASIEQRSNDTGMNTPFASVGITSPGNTTGISYSHGGEYPVTSAPLQDRRALFFNTSPRQITGVLLGHVTDVETGDPIFEASVFTSFGQVAITDENGYYHIDDALAQEFSLTATKQGYNDSTITDLALAEDCTLEVDFALLHPEFIPSTLLLPAILEPERETMLPFNIRNDGNGPLDWSLTKRLPRNADFPPWELRLSHGVGELVNDSRIEGVVFADSLFYIAGANYAAGMDDPNTIYILNKDGELLDTLPQPDTLNGDYGMKDLAWDGNLIWGSGCRRIAGMNLEGEVEVAFAGPYNTNRALAWDPDREVLWVSDITRGITAVDVDREGEVDTTLNRKGFRIYGLAYWEDDPDGYPLYIFHNPQGGRQYVHKMNPEDGDTIFVADLGSQVEGNAGGVFITNQYDVYSWVFINITNDADEDRIDLWQLDARRDWFRVYSREGEERFEVFNGAIQASEQQDFELDLSAVDLVPAVFEGILTYFHNAVGGETIIDVCLEVIGPRPPEPFTLLEPADSTTINANQDSTTVQFIWETSVDYNAGDVVSYELWFKSGDDSAMIESAEPLQALDLIDVAEELGLSIEVDFPLEWWVFAVSGEDRVESNDRFGLFFLPNAILGQDAGLPVEFGLHSIYPSPFNSMTTVRFGVDRQERIGLYVFDIMGRKVCTLFDRTTETGYHQVVWDASVVPSGIYILRLEATGRHQTAKVTLIR